MEIGRDARIARDRLLDALAGCTDLETRKSLWRAALRYHERVLESRRERARLEMRTPRAGHTHAGDGQSVQAACMFD